MNEDLAFFFLRQLLKVERLNDVQELVFRLSWQGKTYQQIAEVSDYDDDYIRDIGFHLWRSLSAKLNTKVTKKNIHSVLANYLDCQQKVKNTGITEKTSVSRQQFRDWGEAIDTKIFYGRDRELQDVTNWIIKDNCRLVGVFGIGGVGKTAFAAKLVREIAEEFDYLIWRSLRNAPKIEAIFLDLIQFFSHQQELTVNLSQDVDSQLRKLLSYLRNSRCLIILDNLESILQSCAGSYDGREGCYSDGYSGFGQLLETVADTEHQSCLLVTGREIPVSFWGRSHKNAVTRYLQLAGLNLIEARKIIEQPSSLESNCNKDKLINYYAGNPLALKIVSATICEIFDENVTEFWQSDVGLFGDINDLLKQQCDRLSTLEINIIYWLTLARESINFAELKNKFLGNISQAQILTIIQSLKQRSLIEKSQKGFTLQPLVMDFFSNRFLNDIEQEIITKKLNLLTTHTWLICSDKNYAKANQIKFFCQPLIQRLKNRFYSFNKLEAHLKEILKLIQQESDKYSGYGTVNLINLLHQLNTDLTDYDLSNLTF